ncbi:MAG TPA: M15 family metallopeptidase [Candidatus Mediterraneibacter intestinigallinarum]|nr:M15 family metallopeptidase [Candidatus Mediterraneibacter intestinigallinarum]
MMEDYLVLVNAEHPLRVQMDKTDLVCAFDDHPGVLLERTAAKALRALLTDIGNRDSIVPVSGWRSREEQKKIWEDTVAEKGIAFARKYVALPACSEHETGLAIDLAANAQDIDFICPEFPRSGICQKFREAAPYYGFVERYAKEKEPVTGISGEPWHFRYVGTPHSEIMARKGMCLEEYVERRRYCEERKTR